MLPLSIFLLLIMTTDSKPRCRNSCPSLEEDAINVHIIPHSHDDVGWLKTIDQYYYGSKGHIQKASIWHTLASVKDALLDDPNRRFSVVEMAYFWMYWTSLNKLEKSQVTKLVQEGRLEFISGGWSMHDEATTYYQSIIDQFTLGLKKLNDTFGECGHPSVGWQIDPFGHSITTADFSTLLGFNGLLLGRIDYNEKENRSKTKSLEFLWQGLPPLRTLTLTSVLYQGYQPPYDLCFDIKCHDEPIVDDRNSPEFNLDEKLKFLFDRLEKMREVYYTNNLLVTMGDDFAYMSAVKYYENLDLLIHHANQRPKLRSGFRYKLFYSTPSCYIKAVAEKIKKEGYISPNSNRMKMREDMFPYASDPHAYWTGYFTSRPSLKRFERIGNNFLQICKQLASLAELPPHQTENLEPLMQIMGAMQHHDAITGTAKQDVTNDYLKQLSVGMENANNVASHALNFLMKSPKRKHQTLSFSSCPLLNISQCEISESAKTFVVTIYNPLSRNISYYVRLPILEETYSVLNAEGKVQLTQRLKIPNPVLDIPGRESLAKYELLFLASDVPPFGFRSYYIKQTEAGFGGVRRSRGKSIRQSKVSVEINPSTGFLKAIQINGSRILIHQNFHYYVGVNSGRASGAYIFRPNGTLPFPVAEKAEYKIYHGKLISEIHQVFGSWVSQVIRCYMSEAFVEFEWLVGPIPNDTTPSKEVITRYETNLKSQSRFIADSNGKGWYFRRVKAANGSQEPISQNYFPIAGFIGLKSWKPKQMLMVVTDRPQGGSSLQDGFLELMLHRMCLRDDSLGVGEPLMEKEFGQGLVARGSHYLTFGPDHKNVMHNMRDILNRKLMQAWIFLSETQLTFEEYRRTHRMEFSGLNRNLPESVKILTLEPWRENQLLLRLENLFCPADDKALAMVEVDLKSLFAPFEIVELRETTLGGNIWLDETDQILFRENENPEETDEFIVGLKANQIRTFIITVKFRCLENCRQPK